MMDLDYEWQEVRRIIEGKTDSAISRLEQFVERLREDRATLLEAAERAALGWGGDMASYGNLVATIERVKGG